MASKASSRPPRVAAGDVARPLDAGGGAVGDGAGDAAVAAVGDVLGGAGLAAVAGIAVDAQVNHLRILRIDRQGAGMTGTHQYSIR